MNKSSWKFGMDIEYEKSIQIYISKFNTDENMKFLSRIFSLFLESSSKKQDESASLKNIEKI